MHSTNYTQTLGTIISQADHQAILRKHIEALGGKIELGCALTGLEQVEGGVRAKLQKTVGSQTSEETATFAYLIGADGAKSKIYLIMLTKRLNNAP